MADRFLRIKEVRERTGLSTTTIYDRMKEGAFPKQIKLGERVAVWLESEIDAWIEAASQARAA
ncbi:transcriptional regulator [Chromobacterium amazonense]|uniref:Transcriptional regulator n=1 Tax=Chromobacterium amazonense TaxID=1382803 RepID=A0A2S9X606_9NEIS|nr:AlpA family transcriptional regulator [Chromobacterium amazonense]PRP71116.1 transcriptional regulator [Chromobacterium amazonense]